MHNINFRYDLLTLKDKLFRLALRITQNREEAEDITEEVLVRVWERREYLNPEIRSLEAYCLTSCRNLALDVLARKETQNVSLKEEHDIHADNALTPHEQIERNERLQRVRRIFDSLPEKQRSVMQLRDIEEHSVRETAQILQISEEDVKVTLHRARQNMRKQLLKTETND